MSRRRITGEQLSRKHALEVDFQVEKGGDFLLHDGWKGIKDVRISSQSRFHQGLSRGGRVSLTVAWPAETGSMKWRVARVVGEVGSCPWEPGCRDMHSVPC